MNVEIKQGNNTIYSFAETLIIIDVLRAGTTAHYILNAEPSEVVLSESINKCYSYAQEGDVLIGEQGGYKVPGFTFGNSPSEIYEHRELIKGKRVVFLTSNGVKAICNNLHFNEIYLCGLVNAKITAEKLANNKDHSITILASHPHSDDDLACAEYIAYILTGNNKISINEVIKRIDQSESAWKFHHNDDFPIRDLEICKREDHNPGFIIEIIEMDGLVKLKENVITSPNE